MDTDKISICIDHAKCPPCAGLICVGVCPEGILEPDSKGKPKISDPTNCTLCGVCVDLCPKKAISKSSGKQVKKR